MSDFILFWIAKAVTDLLIGLAFLSAIGVIWLLLAIPGMRRQSKCPHDTFRETSACDAICSSCGKNLGFIGTVRESRKKESL